MTQPISFKQNIQYGALKDRLPQNVGEKLPENMQNFSTEDIKDGANDTWVASVAKGTSVKGLNVKQVAISILGAVAVVFGLSAITKHFVNSNGIFKAGEVLDKFWNKLKGTKLGESAKKIKNSKFITDLSAKYKNSSFGKLFAKDSSGIRSNLVRPKLSMVANSSYTQGSKWEACDEITDALENMLKSDGKPRNSFRKFLAKIGWLRKEGTRFHGEDGIRKLIEDSGHKDKADDLIKILKDYIADNGNLEAKYKVKDSFMPIFKDYFGVDDTKKLSEAFKNINHKDFYQQIRIQGLSHDVDMLNAYKQMLIMDGKGATTPLGKGFQKFILKAVEAPTNGIMSRGKIGLGMALYMYYGIMNKIQKAPKEEKVATAGNEFTTDIGGYMLLPVNAGIVYGLASLKNLGGNGKAYSEAVKNINKKLADNAGNALKYTRSEYLEDVAKAKSLIKGKWWQKPFIAIGKTLSLGLDKIEPYTADLSKGAAKIKNLGSKAKGFVGGAGRFIAVMFIVAPLLIKPISKLASKVFGKTEEMKKEEAEKLAKKEAKKMKKQGVNKTPENTLNMTKEEFLTKLLAHPELIEKINNDPEFAKQLTENPQMLIEMLNAPETQTQEQNANSQTTNSDLTGTMSPNLRRKLENAQKTNNSTQTLNNMAQQTQTNPFNTLNNNTLAQQQTQALNQEETEKEPTRTYIPSSKPFKPNLTLSNEEQNKIKKALEKASSAEEDALKYLS